MILADSNLNNLTLVTHNTKDFEWIESLSVIDPLAE